jgi:hypothetical protein
MNLVYFLLLTALFAGCADSGYHPQYIISKDEVEVPEDVR